MKSNVRKYTTPELLKRVSSLPSFSGFPKKDFIIGVRSNENEFNSFDDKFYHFNKELKCINVLSGTTQSGSYGFKNWFKWSNKGVAEIKANEWYYNVWSGGLHKGRMKALRQVGWFKVLRLKSIEDYNNDYEIEWNKGLNFHTSSYNRLNKVIKWIVGGWSVGCQVANDVQDYYKSLDRLYYQDYVTYCLIDEF